MYALYKQATAGKAPGYNAKTPRRALLRGRGARRVALPPGHAEPRSQACLYAKVVADNRKNRETKEPQTPRTRARDAAVAWRADRDLLDASLDGMDPKTLLAHARKLRDRVQTLSVGHVMRGRRTHKTSRDANGPRLGFEIFRSRARLPAVLQVAHRARIAIRSTFITFRESCGRRRL